MNTPQPVLSASSLYAPESCLSVPEPLVSDLPSDLPVARTGGFTLTRLLLVIAVVGTLSALAAPALFPIQH